MDYVGTIDSYSTLSHHGVKGMKWGVRRYQNADGSLNAAGKKHYQKKADRSAAVAKSYASMSKKYNKFGTRTFSDSYRTKANRARIKSEYMSAKASGDSARIKQAKTAYGKEIAKHLLINDGIRGTYNRHLSSGDNKAVALGKTTVAAYLNPLYYSTM